MYVGASAATGADIDPFAAAAIEINTRANGRRVTVVRRDVLDEEPPDVDLILAGDCWYDARLAERVLPWLHRARDRRIEILVGDPGRRYLPTDELVELASYNVRTTTELEDLERRQGRVYALRPASSSRLSGPLASLGAAETGRAGATPRQTINRWSRPDR
jgi:predicted nicotinamide N-methyase